MLPYALIMMISALFPITPNMKISRTVTAMMLPIDLTETIMHCTTCFSPATANDHDQRGYWIGAFSDGLYGYDHALQHLLQPCNSTWSWPRRIQNRSWWTTIMHCTTCFSPATVHDHDQEGYRIGAVSDGLDGTIMHCTTCFSPATLHDHHQGGYRIGAFSDGLYGYDHALHHLLQPCNSTWSWPRRIQNRSWWTTIMHCTTCFSPATAHDHDQGGYRIGAVSDGRDGYDHALHQLL